MGHYPEINGSILDFIHIFNKLLYNAEKADNCWQTNLSGGFYTGFSYSRKADMIMQFAENIYK